MRLLKPHLTIISLNYHKSLSCSFPSCAFCLSLYICMHVLAPDLHCHVVSGPAIPMNPVEAAQSIFPPLARALQKYLRITRQQPRYSMESIIEHLALCISYDASPKAFIDRYLQQGAVIWNEKEQRASQTWALVCSQLVSRTAGDGCTFALRQGDVSLLVRVRKMPHFNLTEDVLDPKNNKFVLRLNSETSV